MSTDTFLSEIDALYKEYSKKHPKRGVSSISRRSGVNETSLRRALNGDRTPSFPNCLKLLHEFYETESLTELYSLASSSQKELISHHLPQLISTDFDYNYKAESERTLIGLTETEVFLFMLVSTLGKVHSDDIEKRHGKRGLVAVDDLSEVGLLVADDEGFLSPKHESLRFTERCSAFIYTKFIQQAYREKPEKSLNFGVNELVTEEAYEELKEIHIDSSNRIRKIIKDNPGSRAICSFQAMVCLNGGSK